MANSTIKIGNFVKVVKKVELYNGFVWHAEMHDAIGHVFEVRKVLFDRMQLATKSVCGSDFYFPLDSVEPYVREPIQPHIMKTAENKLEAENPKELKPQKAFKIGDIVRVVRKAEPPGFVWLKEMDNAIGKMFDVTAVIDDRVQLAVGPANAPGVCRNERYFPLESVELFTPQLGMKLPNTRREYTRQEWNAVCVDEKKEPLAWWILPTISIFSLVFLDLFMTDGFTRTLWAEYSTPSVNLYVLSDAVEEFPEMRPIVHEALLDGELSPQERVEITAKLDKLSLERIRNLDK